MKILISADSCLDLPESILKENNIQTLPFTVTIGDKVFLDNEINEEDLYSFADETGIYPKTSAINLFQYSEFFKKYAKEYDYLIHICISSKISSAFNNASIAAEEYPNVYVFDSLNVSSGMGLLVLKAVELREQGKTAEEILEALNEITPRIVFSFLANDFNYIYKGGRCNPDNKQTSTKPAIRMYQNGLLVNYNKYVGKNSACVEQFVLDIIEEFKNADKTYSIINFTPDCTDTMIDIVKTKLLDAGFGNIIISKATSTVCCHGGPKTITVGLINNI